MDTTKFLEDIYPDQLLYAVTIRSPVANGHLRLIQFPKLPVNYIMITARNIPGENRLEDTAIPILAEGRLSYIGEPVALLLGQDKTKLEELAANCTVLVDEEKPVFSYEGERNAPFAKRELQIGDTTEAFEKAEKIVRGNYDTGIQEHWYAEPTGAITWYEDRQKSSSKKKASEKTQDADVTDGAKTQPPSKKHEKVLIIKTATQWPYHVKRSVARVLGIDVSAVSVEPTTLSLHMDGKLMYPSFVACHAALGTLITKKPVRLILNRKEDFLYSPKRCKTHIDIASAVDEKGNISAAEIEISVNLGAFGVNSDEIIDQVCLGSLGFYNCGNIKLTARANRTNIPPQGPFSGFGMAQGFFAMERHISRVADEISQDPADWRKYRANPAGILPSGSPSKGQVSTDELIAAVSSMSDYYRKWAAYELLRQARGNQPVFAERGENLRGVGIAIGYQGNGFLYHGEDMGSYSVEVTLTEKNTLEIKTSMTRPNHDFIAIWAEIASEILSINPEAVHVAAENSPDCGPSCSSRNITTITKLVEKCCHTIRKQRGGKLPITVRRSVKPQNGDLWGGLFTPSEGKVFDISGFTKPGWAAAVVEVTVDLAEHIPKIRGVWLVIDGGKIISEDKARKRLASTVPKAIGWAFTENIEYINGLLPDGQFDNFAIPSPAGIPPIYIDFIKSDSSESKGIGELPFACIPAAFLQAVSQAMDHSFTSIPLKRKEIWEAVLQRNSQQKKAE